MPPKVSVITVTYNHEKFIAQTIESVMMQNFSEPFEMIIAEDCSTDRTREIVQVYKNKYPDKIKLILNPTNIGAQRNFAQVVSAATGQYVAILDGDDYWTDPDKLRKQVEYMDSHPDVNLCWHKVDIFSEENEFETYCSHRSPRYFEKFDVTELLFLNFMPTSSILYRNMRFELPDWFYRLPMGDYPLNLLNARYGKIWGIDETMAAHRVHKGGIWETKRAEYAIRNHLKYMGMYIHFNRETNRQYEDTVFQVLYRNMNLLAQEYHNKGFLTEHARLEPIIMDWKEMITFKFLRNSENKNVVAFGTGKGAQDACLFLRDRVEVSYFVDNNFKRWGQIFNGRLVLPPSRLLSEDKDKLLVLIFSSFSNEITAQLQQMGIDESHYNIFVYRYDVDTIQTTPEHRKKLLDQLEDFLAEEGDARQYVGTQNDRCVHGNLQP